MRFGYLLRGIVSALVFSALAPAAVIIDKVPDDGGWWSPLSSGGTYVYANSFVFTGVSGTVADTLGVYMLVEGGGTGSPFRSSCLETTQTRPTQATFWR